MCRLCDVSRSGYYAFKKKAGPSNREVADAELGDEIEQIHEASRGTYGRPRIHKQLQRDGKRVGKDRVARLMRERGVAGRVKRRFRVTTDSKHDRPVPENVLQRQFSPSEADSVWCSDITYIWTDMGWVYLSIVIDIATRMIVGWAMADHMRVSLVLEALNNALGQRDLPENALHHSDRGVQYASEEYQAALEASEIQSSMSRKGNCWDNAVAESWFGTFKQEFEHHECWRGLEDARSAVFEYIEVFYNRTRLHSALGYRTPMEVDRELALKVA